MTDKEQNQRCRLARKQKMCQKTENVPMFSPAGYAGLFCQYLYIKAVLFLLILELEVAAMLIHLLSRA